MKNCDISLLLNKHYKNINTIILSRQDPITGLLPASTAINLHGDYTDAWVRDNVYSILSVWGLAISYKKYQPDDTRTYTLSQSVVKLMRGLLTSMMRQSHKVEAFKNSLNPIDALHAKYGTNTGLEVVEDHAWGHLQLDATSIFLLQLAQMTASGLNIIYTIDEVNFVQNLVHYVSRTYCTPDYGIWERGNKINRGTTEINCSSIGMAKAALEALNGFNLLGNVSGNEGVIHVIVNDIARSRFTLHGLLPKESNSKETDASLLSIIGYPAYAVENEELVKITREKIVDKLEGEYGCKRFLLDGHQSSIEDSSKLHYKPTELKQFEDIESEWPLFFTYFLIDAHLREDHKSIEKYKSKLKPLFIEKDGQMLLPELYIVPEDLMEAEKQNPKSQKRVPNENIPLVWAQSLYMLSEMIDDKILRAGDIDPLKRREKLGVTRKTTPLVAILSQNENVKQMLLNHGIQSETLDDVKPIKVMYSDELSKVHKMLGKNDKLGLKGRPLLESRTITTSFIYKIAGEEMIFLPFFFNPKGFYFSYDNRLLSKQFESSLKFLAEHWDQLGQPLITFFVREDMLLEKEKEVILNLLHKIQDKNCGGVDLKNNFLSQLKNTVAVEKIDYLHDIELHDLSTKVRSFKYHEPPLNMGYKLNNEKLIKLNNSDTDTLVQILIKNDNQLEIAIVLKILIDKVGTDYKVKIDSIELSLLDIAQIHYKFATLHHDWTVVRRLTVITNKYDDRLEDALLDVVIRQKQLAVGRAYDENATLSKPYDSLGIIEKIKSYCGTNTAEDVLTQEIILHLGFLIRTDPQLFENILTIRTWYLVQLMIGEISVDKELSLGESYEYLISLSPYEIYTSLYNILNSFVSKVQQLNCLESLNLQGVVNTTTIKSCDIDNYSKEIDNWLKYRKETALIGHLDKEVKIDLWNIMEKCKSLVIGDKYNINSSIREEDVLESTQNERRFELLIDHKLQQIGAPEYKQLNIELINTLARFFEKNKDIYIEDEVVFDVLIGYAVRLSWVKDHGDENYDEDKAKAWDAFYHLSPKEVNEAYIEALIYLVK
jgi:phosphorylase kinase alpha/beta subunit